MTEGPIDTLPEWLASPGGPATDSLRGDNAPAWRSSPSGRAKGAFKMTWDLPKGRLTLHDASGDTLLWPLDTQRLTLQISRAQQHVLIRDLSYPWLYVELRCGTRRVRLRAVVPADEQREVLDGLPWLSSEGGEDVIKVKFARLQDLVGALLEHDLATLARWSPDQTVAPKERAPLDDPRARYPRPRKSLWQGLMTLSNGLVWVVLGFLLGLVGLGLISWGLLTAVEEWRFDTGGRTVEGTVIDLYRSPEDKKSRVVRYYYVVEGGETYEGEDEVPASTFEALQAQQAITVTPPVTIQYLEEDPHTSRVANHSGTGYGFPIFLTIFGVLFLVATPVGYRITLHPRLRDAGHLHAHGRQTLARVVRHERRGTLKHLVKLDIDCEYEDLEGQTHRARFTFKSQGPGPFWNPPKIKVGDTLLVYYDTLDPSRCAYHLPLAPFEAPPSAAPEETSASV